MMAPHRAEHGATAAPRGAFQPLSSGVSVIVAPCVRHAAFSVPQRAEHVTLRPPPPRPRRVDGAIPKRPRCDGRPSTRGPRRSSAARTRIRRVDGAAQRRTRRFPVLHSAGVGGFAAAPRVAFPKPRARVGAFADPQSAEDGAIVAPRGALPPPPSGLYTFSVRHSSGFFG